MRAEVSKIQHSLNVTTVYVTHDQIEAMTMGDARGAVAGVLQQVDTPQSLRPSPQPVRRRFIGSPQMNLLQAAVSRNGNDTTLRVGSCTLTVPPSPLAASRRWPATTGRSPSGSVPSTSPAPRAPRTRSAESSTSARVSARKSDAVGVDIEAQNSGETSDRAVVARGAAHHDAGR